MPILGGRGWHWIVVVTQLSKCRAARSVYSEGPGRERSLVSFRYTTSKQCRPARF